MKSLLNLLYIPVVWRASAHPELAVFHSPIPKRDVVRARVYCMVIAVAIPFAFLNSLINPAGHQAGMNPNIAFFGTVFMMYAVFNAVFPARVL